VALPTEGQSNAMTITKLAEQRQRQGVAMAGSLIVALFTQGSAKIV